MKALKFHELKNLLKKIDVNFVDVYVDPVASIFELLKQDEKKGEQKAIIVENYSHGIFVKFEKFVNKFGFTNFWTVEAKSHEHLIQLIKRAYEEFNAE